MGGAALHQPAKSRNRGGVVDVTLTRIGNQPLNVGGDSTFIVDLDRIPPTKR
jgi:D-alanyl-D-alanine dipeptidase